MEAIETFLTSTSASLTRRWFVASSARVLRSSSSIRRSIRATLSSRRICSSGPLSPSRCSHASSRSSSRRLSVCSLMSCSESDSSLLCISGDASPRGLVLAADGVTPRDSRGGAAESRAPTLRTLLGAICWAPAERTAAPAPSKRITYESPSRAGACSTVPLYHANGVFSASTCSPTAYCM